MKKLFLFAFIGILSFAVNAQITTPQPSPASKIEQKVGVTDVTIEYSRPGVKGRTIFGDLEPWGTIWRTGANKNTTITFSDDFTFDGQEVKAGTYAVYTKLVSATSWEVMLYSDNENWGTPRNWDDSKVVATAKAKVHEVPFTVETFTLDINNIKNSSATLDMMWEKSYVSVPFTVPTSDKVSESITKVMGGPTAEDYYSAAMFYFEEGKDINKAVEWIDMAVTKTAEQPRFWYIHQQALMHAKAGNKKGAIEAAKKSLELAKKADYKPYIKKNEDVLKEWGAM